MKNKAILLGTVTLLLFLCAAVPQTTVVYAATDYKTVNIGEYYGASSTSWAIYNSLFESDPDVKSLITDNELALWGTDVSLEGLTLDYTEFSYGVHTTDWTGTVGSTTDYNLS